MLDFLKSAHGALLITNLMLFVYILCIHIDLSRLKKRLRDGPPCPTGKPQQDHR